MSAKGRGRHAGGEHDYYPTPAWCVERLLDACGETLFAGAVTGDCNALEPTCGDGAIVRAAQRWLADRGMSAHWTGVELRRDALAPGTCLDRHIEGKDFRAWAGTHLFHVTIGNPPYVIAEDIIRCALATTFGPVAMLLRTGFLGSDERVQFWRTVGANPALYVLPDRPSFDGEGTDSATYAWFVWNAPSLCGVHMLDSTPLAVRKAQKPQGLAFEASQGSLFGGPR